MNLVNDFWNIYGPIVAREQKWLRNPDIGDGPDMKGLIFSGDFIFLQMDVAAGHKPRFRYFFREVILKQLEL